MPRIGPHGPGVAFARTEVVNDDPAVMADARRPDPPSRRWLSGHAGSPSSAAASPAWPRPGRPSATTASRSRCTSRRPVRRAHRHLAHCRCRRATWRSTKAPTRSCARVPDAVDLCRELGIETELVSPATGRAQVLAGGELRELPTNSVLGVPLDLDDLAATGIVSRRRPRPGSAAEVDRDGRTAHHGRDDRGVPLRTAR